MQNRQNNPEQQVNQVVELSDEDLQSIAGGLNPQPIPPGSLFYNGYKDPFNKVTLNPQPEPPGAASRFE
jgi:hypothetical protein